MTALSAQSWPGNARELRNAIDSFVALGTLPGSRPMGVEGDALERALAEFVTPDRPYADQKEELADRFTRVYLRALMQRVGGNQSEAARVSGLERSYLGKLLVKHGIGKR